MTNGALFIRNGERFMPTEIARGPWRPDALHGGAVAALLAQAVDLPGRTVARLTFDLLAPVPLAPLTISVEPPQGGARVVRQTVILCAGDRVVAKAAAVGVRQGSYALPPEAVRANPLAGVAVPDLTHLRPELVDHLGWESFDSSAIALRSFLLPASQPGAFGVFVALLADVIAGEASSAVARAVAGADYASGAAYRQLSFREWSFMNTEMTVHLLRVPDPEWIGIVSTGHVEGNGTGLSDGVLYDAGGHLGQVGQALVVERRAHPSS